jgi:hypothetical protein
LLPLICKITASYYPAVKQLIREHTGATRVEVFDHTIRKRSMDKHGNLK